MLAISIETIKELLIVVGGLGGLFWIIRKLVFTASKLIARKDTSH